MNAQQNILLKPIIFCSFRFLSFFLTFSLALAVILNYCFANCWFCFAIFLSPSLLYCISTNAHIQSSVSKLQIPSFLLLLLLLIWLTFIHKKKSNYLFHSCLRELPSTFVSFLAMITSNFMFLLLCLRALCATFCFAYGLC